MRCVVSALKRFLRSLPLVGRLGEVPSDERRQALYETLTTSLFATMPFWVLPALGYFLYSPKPTLDEAMQKGEGLIYAAALLGPLVYVLTRRYGRFNLLNNSRQVASPLSMSFPYGGLFVTITALSCAVAGFAFASMQHSGSGIDQQGVRLLSWVMMIGATFIFFLVTAYSNMLDGLEKKKSELVVEEQPRQESQFVTDWMAAKS